MHASKHAHGAHVAYIKSHAAYTRMHIHTFIHASINETINPVIIPRKVRTDSDTEYPPIFTLIHQQTLKFANTSHTFTCASPTCTCTWYIHQYYSPLLTNIHLHD